MKIRLQTVRVTSFRLTDPGSNVDGLKMSFVIQQLQN